MSIPIQLPASRAGRLGALAAFWLGFGVVAALHTYVTLTVREVPYRPAYALSAMIYSVAWMGITPLAARLTRRFPPVGRGWVRRVPIHLVFLAVAEMAVVAIAVFVAGFVDPERPPYERAFVMSALGNSLLYLLTYAGIVGAVLAYDASQEAAVYEERAREREVRAARLRERAAQLEGQLARAQVDALRMQLNPHFLFNTLHAASTLMARDVPAARSVLADLSGLLRLSLDRVGDPEIALADELDFLRHYLDIERTRFRDRLVIEERIDPAVLDALVPTLLLQPLVENAVKHGIAPRGEGGTVEVEARREGDALVLSVADDGPGLAENAGGDGQAVAPSTGIGLANTRERLRALYGPDAHLALADRPEGGVRAEVRLPFHTVPVESA